MSRLNTRSYLNLDQLTDRLVPATLVDLTTAGAVGGANGAILRQVDAQPTGTGFIHSFVRVQSAANGSAVTESGYNTTARPLQFDENRSPQFTREVTLDDVPTVTVDNVVYREFLLDINQKSSAPKLSLDEVRLFLGDTPNLTGYDATTNKLAGRDAVFNLDGSGDVSVLLNYRLNTGSGSGDMTLLVPQSAFDGASASTYVYLYSKFGGVAGGGGNSGGNTGGGGGAGTNSLSGRVFLDSVLDDGTQQEGEPGLPGVIIHLDGTDSVGQTVNLIALTDANGDYEFVNLLDGLYTITEEQPQAYLDGRETLGTLGLNAGGTIAGNDMFGDLLLTGGTHGLHYNFAEVRADGP